MATGGEVMNMTYVMPENLGLLGLDVPIGLGGGGTARNALRLSTRGMPALTLSETIDPPDHPWVRSARSLGVGFGDDRHG